MCKYYYTHENNTIMERSKFVCTQADMTNLKDRMQQMVIVDICTRQRANTNWKFNKLANLTIFASILKDAPMATQVTVFLNHFWKSIMLNVLLLGKIGYNPTMTISVCLEH